ncbi:MAG: cellulose biosynthesis cyclic di-GMP-binding regulatory protein BcsB, partial [Methylobacteriaceae bacterium]|nr:cellulose biosynthesis cyclic di-GMP-binding regulatory protein BcsB [Methylobacteriaceae bacterium]
MTAMRASLALILALFASAASAQPSLFQAAPMTRIEAPAAPRPAAAAPVKLESPPRIEAPARTDASAKPVVAPPPPAAPAGPRLRHLHNNAQGYRLAGEIGASEWPIYLTAAQAAAPLRFQLGYLSAVSVMPEASTLTVQINEVTIGAAPIKAPHSVSVLTFDVPADAVKPGFNALRISVQQRHRVDCSLQATYELWAQIDPAQTGFLFAADDAGVAAIEDLPALPPNPQGAMQVRALIPENTEIGAVDRVLRAAQAIAVNGRFEQVLVDVETTLAADAYGVNLAVGRWDELRRVAGLETLADPGGPRLAVLPAVEGGRPTILATGSTPADVDAALDKLMRETAARGAPQGLRAA